MEDAGDLLELARGAMGRHAWEESFNAFKGANDQLGLSAEDLEAMSEAAFWAGKSRTAVDVRQKAHIAYVEAGRLPEAAAAALTVCTLSFMMGDTAVASGWLGRAQRLLVDLPECAGHAHFAWLEGQFWLIAKDNERALERAQEVEAIAERVKDRDLAAMGISMQGYVRSRTGDVNGGMHLLDEALATATAGELGPFATAEIICEMIVSCLEIADYKRAGEWLDTAERVDQLTVCFPGCCRTHRATLLRHHGEWEKAHLQAKQARTELADTEVLHQGMVLYEMGEIYRSRGELTLAERAFEEAHEKACSPQPGLALLLLGKRDLAGATNMIAAAIERFADEPAALIRLLPAQVDVALAAGDVPLADAAATRLAAVASTLGSTAAAAASACAAGLILHKRGDLAAAAHQLNVGVQSWQQARTPYQAAQARMHLATVLEEQGDTGSARLELSTARRAFESLGALPEALETARRLNDDSPRHTSCTFMFTDIVNSTSLLTTIGDDGWHSVRRWHDRTLSSLVVEHEGRIVKETGDGFFAAFDDSALAVDCAVAIQRTLDKHRHAHGFSPSIRIGLHMGSATSLDQDYAGRDVVVAARIADTASADEILVSADLAARAGSAVIVLRRSWVSLKGIPDPVEVVAIDWC